MRGYNQNQWENIINKNPGQFGKINYSFDLVWSWADISQH